MTKLYAALVTRFSLQTGSALTATQNALYATAFLAHMNIVVGAATDSNSNGNNGNSNNITSSPNPSPSTSHETNYGS
ncbi:hypothetical protein J3Q64DRAFT_1843584 [Phycomyces blakesleeanus]|uniref:Uncharacterized protein n=1 Tax=Phycomyces blakesleeanus TaxID=4837 RepID=A0ABR3BBB9_PHYBL